MTKETLVDTKQITPAEPIAYFVNSQGARLAVYDEKQLADAIARGYTRVSENTPFSPSVKEPHKEEKIC